ncbi:AMP-binding protein [Leucobacter sp. W1153]|uniref:AMP-binding protein n=1 Tax=Leucobacter sp. W1153 TaxID=3439064 RepID=UPI003F2ED30F
MTSKSSLRAIPTEDRAWLLAALADALQGGAPVLPVHEGADPKAIQRLQGEELPQDTALVVRTSGSSGIPKAVALSAAALRASAEATHEAFGGPGQWLVALPPHLISGLQMLVRSAESGVAPEFYDGPFDPAALLARAERMRHERRYVSLVPVQFGRLLALAEADPAAADTLRSFEAVLVGGQAISLEMRRRAHSLGIALKRSYGMTETAGGCVYDGVEIGDTRVRIRAGEVQLAGPTLALGYVGDAQLTADRFIIDRGERWYRTGDAGYLLGGMLSVTGRLDRVIISGGVNVSLDEIERVASAHLGGAVVAAVGIVDPQWGERPVLVVEGVDHMIHEGAEELSAALRAELGPAAIPARFVEVAELPRLEGGKPDHRQISETIT